MELSVAEAAALLGVSTRAVRGQLTRGALAGRKVGSQWRIDRATLPLTEGQRARIAEVRAVVDAALPATGATSRGERSRSVADLDAFRLGAALLPDAHDADPALGEELDEALVPLGRAVHTFLRADKLAALADARARIAAVATRLHLRGHGNLGTRVEREVLPALVGFARWVEKLPASVDDARRGRP